MIVTRENFLDAFAELQRLALEKSSAVVYDIHFCNAGVGINWYEASRVEAAPDYAGFPPEVERDRWKEGLVTYQYHEDMLKMVQAELDRLKEAATHDTV